MDIARKLRTWFPGAVYHIMHRGVRRKAIFQEEIEYSCAVGSSAIIRFGSFSMIRYIV